MYLIKQQKRAQSFFVLVGFSSDNGMQFTQNIPALSQGYSFVLTTGHSTVWKVVLPSKQTEEYFKVKEIAVLCLYLNPG